MDINEHLQRLGLKNVPGEVFDDDTVVIEIKNDLSENLTNQNPLHMKQACNTSISNAKRHQKVWYGRRWAVHTPFQKTFAGCFSLKFFKLISFLRDGQTKYTIQL